MGQAKKSAVRDMLWVALYNPIIASILFRFCRLVVRYSTLYSTVLDYSYDKIILHLGGQLGLHSFTPIWFAHFDNIYTALCTL